MTYGEVLAVYVVPVLAAVFIANVWLDGRRRGPRPWWAVAGLALVALIYTTPWDNYLVATGVWWYDPRLVSGLTLGWVPAEEYCFFILQTLLTGLWTAALVRGGEGGAGETGPGGVRMSNGGRRGGDRPGGAGRRAAGGGVAAGNVPRPDPGLGDAPAGASAPLRGGPALGAAPAACGRHRHPHCLPVDRGCPGSLCRHLDHRPGPDHGPAGGPAAGGGDAVLSADQCHRGLRRDPAAARRDSGAGPATSSARRRG